MFGRIHIFKIIILITLILLNISCGHDGHEKYEIKFGYLTTKNAKTFSFLEETDVVPLVTMSAGMFYGIEIKPKHDSKYEVYVKVILPNKEIVDVGEYMGIGVKVIPMGFDSSDIEGKYKLDVYIDGSLASSIRFTAVTINQ